VKKINYFLSCVVISIVIISFGGVAIPEDDSAAYARADFRILCLGDSMTAKGGDQSYPSQLERILNEKGKGGRVHVINGGQAETTVSDIAAALPGQIKQYSPDMIVVMTGINEGPRPAGYSPFTRLGWSYKEKGDRLAAIGSFRKAIILDPRGYREHTEFAIFYLKSGDFKEAEALLRQAIAINAQEDEAYIVLGWCYLGQNMFAEAETAFKKAAALNPRNPNILAALAVLCEQKGDHDCAQGYYAKADLLRGSYDDPGIRRDLKRIKDIAARQRIPLVCAQYPTRSLALLKRMIDGPEKTVIFVDNEKRFKDGVRQEGYLAYFEDMFAGDFGCCTAKGNHLLADTVAASILNYYSP
jgi:tetratricopeptide (TPR) repeat protein